MKYRSFEIKADNSFYKNGQHAVKCVDLRTGQVSWHDVFTAAVSYVREVSRALYVTHQRVKWAGLPATIDTPLGFSEARQCYCYIVRSKAGNLYLAEENTITL